MIELLQRCGGLLLERHHLCVAQCRLLAPHATSQNPHHRNATDPLDVHNIEAIYGTLQVRSPAVARWARVQSEVCSLQLHQTLCQLCARTQCWGRSVTYPLRCVRGSFGGVGRGCALYSSMCIPCGRWMGTKGSHEQMDASRRRGMRMNQQQAVI